MRQRQTYRQWLSRMLVLALVILGAQFVLGDLGASRAVAATTPPVVTAVTPPNLATGVSVTAPISATFNQEMNPATLTTGSFTLTRQVKIAKISAGQYLTVALKTDGTVASWGQFPGINTVPAGLTGVVAVAAGDVHALALKSDGTVVAWGNNYYGEATVPEGLSGVVEVAGGGYHSIARKSDGTLVAWGTSNYGVTTIPAGLSGVVAISAGEYHNVALQSDGTVVAWGDNSYGQTSVPAGLTGVIAIDAGYNHTVALKNDGTVVAWGNNMFGAATVPSGLSGVVAISAGIYNTVALKSDGTIVAWGDMYDYTASNYMPVTVPAGLSDVVAVSAAYIHMVALKSDGTLVGWGNPSLTRIPAGRPNGITAVTAGNEYTVGLRPNGTVAAWGTNNYNTFSYGEIAVPADLTGVVSISAGKNHTLALKSDGTVAAWGNNSIGQATVPPGLTGVVAVAAGGGSWYDGFSLALKSDGTVVSWGNYWGYYTVPAGISNVVAIAAGDVHTVALKSDGTVVAWGQNWFGQTVVPTGLSGVVAVAAGDGYSAALKSDGTVVMWGSMGAYSGGMQSSVAPAGLTGVVAISGGDTYMAALKSDGTVVLWDDSSNPPGYNGYPGPSSQPLFVPQGLTGVVAISAGATHTVALKSDGTTVEWDTATIVNTQSPYVTKYEGAVSLDATTSTATFTPTSPLPLGATLQASVSGAVKSATGSLMGADYSWSFTTEANLSLSTNVTGNGTLVCTPSSPQPGDNVTCTATPAAGYQLMVLTDNTTDVLGAVSGGNYLIPAIASDHALTALFAPVSQTLTVTISGAGSVAGVTTGYPAALSFTASGSKSVSGGAVVTLTPNPAAQSNSGVVFKGWSGDCTGLGDTNNACQVTMTAAHAVTATFVAAPKITTTNPLTAGTYNVAYSKTLTATGGVAPYTWSLAPGSSLPAGLILNATTGAITGAPTVYGSFTCVIQVKDKNGNSGANTFALDLVPMAITTATPLKSGLVGTTYSAALAAIGGVKPYAWSLISGALPPGIGFNTATGAFSGTPTAAGSFSFTMRVEDLAGAPVTATKAFTIDVAVTPLSIITASPLASGNISTAYSATLVATGGAKPYTWTITAGALPAGVGLNTATGALSGAPTEGGSFAATVQVADKSGLTATKVLTFTVTVPAMTITTASPLTAGTVGGAYSLTLAATGGVKPFTWALASGALPVGLGLNTATGLISGTPASGGNHTVTILVTDKSGAAVTKTFTLNVVAPVLTITTTTPLPSGTVGLVYSKVLTASGGVGPNTWAITSGKLPPGIGLATATGALSGAPAKSGNYTFAATVRDSMGTTASATYTISIP